SWLITFNDLRLSLIAADRRARDLDSHLVGDLQLHLLLVELDNLPVDAAGRDDFVVDLQIVQKLLDLLLLASRRHQDDEVEDAQNEDERHDLQQRVRAIAHRHGEHGAHNRKHHESCGWRDKLWWNASLKLSNRPNAIASLIR